MTPKQQYEARKAARREKKMDSNAKETEMIDMMDRFVTAAERIADAMERPQALSAGLEPDPHFPGRFRTANTFGGNQ